MTADELKNELQDVFRDVFLDDDIELRDDLTAREIQHWNSFNHINLLVAIEQKFNVIISSREAEQLSKVGDLRALLESKLGLCA